MARQRIEGKRERSTSFNITYKDNKTGLLKTDVVSTKELLKYDQTSVSAAAKKYIGEKGSIRSVSSRKPGL